MNDTPNPAEQIRQLFARLQTMGIGRRAPLKNVGLSLSQLAVLLCVHKTAGLRLNELAQQLGVSMPTASVSLRKLEQEGWIRRTTDKEDKRSIHLYLTSKASFLVKRAEAFQQKQTSKFLSGLTPAEQQQLVTLLAKAVTHLEKET